MIAITFPHTTRRRWRARRSCCSIPRPRPVLRALGGRISAADMRQMNYAVDGEKQDPATVVRAFLDKIGGIKPGA